VCADAADCDAPVKGLNETLQAFELNNYCPVRTGESLARD
jgi:hypothetical protein